MGLVCRALNSEFLTNGSWFGLEKGQSNLNPGRLSHLDALIDKYTLMDIIHYTMPGNSWSVMVRDVQSSLTFSAKSRIIANSSGLHVTFVERGLYFGSQAIAQVENLEGAFERIINENRNANRLRWLFRVYQNSATFDPAYKQVPVSLARSLVLELFAGSREGETVAALVPRREHHEIDFEGRIQSVNILVR